jgi:hypothetical protein
MNRKEYIQAQFFRIVITIVNSCRRDMNEIIFYLR